MKNAQFTYHKDKLTKWLLTVTLLFSILTFSEYACNFQSRQQQATQIELVISNNHKSCKGTISYKKAFELIISNDFLISHYKNRKNALLNYNQQNLVKLDSILEQFCSYKSVDHFLQLKTIPQNSDEDILVTFIG